MNLELLLDKVALRDLAEAYARHVDRREAKEAAELFTAEGVLRIVRRGSEQTPVVRTGREELTAAFANIDRYPATLHVVANHYVDIDGDAATGEVYCLAHHLYGEGADQGDHVMVIRYQDRYRREADGWRIAERELRVDWTEDRTVTSP